MIDEKDPDGKSKWAPGEMADGSINIMTIEEARQSIIERNSEEAAWASAFDDSQQAEDEDEGGPVPLDIDSLSPEEISEILEGLG